MTPTAVKKRYFIIDFDSTFSRLEALDELAVISLRGKKERDRILKQMKDITNAGMEGKIPIDESLERRVVLLRANRQHLKALVRHLKRNVTPSFARNKKFLRKYANHIFVLSSGFKEFIIPVVKRFGLLEEHVFANDFLFDKRGNIVGFDRKNPLAKKGGKVAKLKELGLDGDVYAIGDGYTDYELKKSGLASKFFAFTENISRDAVTAKADHIVPTFDELLYHVGYEQ